jgi:addiction module RelB/DinJ family antitoxin
LNEKTGELISPVFRSVVNWVSQLVEVAFEIDSDLKDQAEKVCAEYGLTLEEATILFFKETVRLGKLPFEIDEDLKKYIEGQNTSSESSVGSVTV